MSYTVEYQGHKMDVYLDFDCDIETVILFPQNIDITELMDGTSKELLKTLGEDFDWMFNDLSSGRLWDKVEDAIREERMEGEMMDQIRYYESRGHDMSKYY